MYTYNIPDACCHQKCQVPVWEVSIRLLCQKEAVEVSTEKVENKLMLGYDIGSFL